MAFSGGGGHHGGHHGGGHHGGGHHGGGGHWGSPYPWNWGGYWENPYPAYSQLVVMMDPTERTYCPVHKDLCPKTCPHRKPIPLSEYQISPKFRKGIGEVLGIAESDLMKLGVAAVATYVLLKSL